MSGVITTLPRPLPGLVEPLGKGTEQAESTPKSSENFGDLFSSLIDSVNELHGEAGEVQQALLNGDPIELHQVMIKLEEAGIATDLLLEIRNRLVSGFTELMRMPV